MADIQFYHLTSTPLDRALPKLVEKALQGGFRICISAGSAEKSEAINTMLWTYDPASFLPHGTEKDGNLQEQPVYISGGEEAVNQADLLMVTDGSEANISDRCKRLLDIFDGTDEEAVIRARARWKTYQQAGHIISYIKQTMTGSWEKQQS